MYNRALHTWPCINVMYVRAPALKAVTSTVFMVWLLAGNKEKLDFVEQPIY
jgi:hypothetical protein